MSDALISVIKTERGKGGHMRKWGIVVSVCYALIVLGMLVPAAVYIVGPLYWPDFLKNIINTYQEWRVWVSIVIVLLGQVLLLFLSVDTSWRRMKPRAHVAVSCALAGILTALITVSATLSLGFAVRGDRFTDPLDRVPHATIYFFIACGSLWLLWGIFFYVYLRKSSDVVTRIISWLLGGSVLELLIAVPCHIIVRRRHDCSAPVVTSFGIATGIAIMLLCFGPGVLFLYKKRLDACTPRSSS